MMKRALLVCFAVLEFPGLPLHADTAAVTAVSGPNACFAPPGYSVPSVCTVAGETPLASFPIPAVGGSYVDANFGATVRVLSAAPSNHDYSTPSPYSATGKYVALEQHNVQVNIVEAATGRVIYTGRPGNVTADSLRWDAFNDDVYYYFSGSKIMKHTLSINQTSTLVDYSTDGHGFTGIGAGGTGDTSKDNWLAFWAATQHTVCAINLTTVKTYCGDYTAPHPDSRVGYSFIDYVMVSKGVDSVSHRRYVLLMAAPAAAVFSVNESTGNLDWEYRGPEAPPDTAVSHPGNHDGVCDPNETCLGSPHADVFEDADGQQYLMYAAELTTPCARFIGTFRLNAGSRLLISTAAGGGRSVPMTLHLCGGGPYEAWVDDHWGCARNSPYCVLSTTYWGYRSPTDLTTPIPATTYLDEVMVIRGNGLEVRRLAKNRSVQFTNDEYWSTPRAAISPDGGSVLWDTNFGYPNRGEYVVAANTNFGTPPPPPSAPVVALTNPSAGANLSGTSTLSASATSTVGIAGVNFMIDGAVAGTSTGSPYTFAWDTTHAANGSHTLAVSATDALGRSTATAAISVNVANSAAFTPIRINAGGPAYADPQGGQWAADQAFSGGLTWSTTQSIAATTAGPLYQTCRYGSAFSYTMTAPNGSYSVTLKFAEPTFTAAGQRSFNASINGTQVLREFDIVQQAGGALRAIDRTFPVTVTNGRIVVSFFAGRANSPMVNAVEVVQGAPITAAAVRVNAGGSAFVDPSGRTWDADNGFSGGSVWSVTSPILDTNSTAIYQTCRWGKAFSYGFTVPNGNYNVTLKFAEPTYTLPRQRLFNAAINGVPVLSNFDIVAQAGPLRAIDKTFPASVTNGRIVIQFSQGSADAPMVSGIEILGQ